MLLLLRQISKKCCVNAFTAKKKQKLDASVWQEAEQENRV